MPKDHNTGGLTKMTASRMIDSHLAKDPEGSKQGERKISPRAFEAILAGIEDVIGATGLTTVIRMAGLPPLAKLLAPDSAPTVANNAALNHVMIDIYGQNGARAVMLQVGKAQARDGLKAFAERAHDAQNAIRNLPPTERIRIALEYSATIARQEVGTNTRLDDDAAYFYWEDEECIQCVGLELKAPCCHTTAGFLLGIAQWVTGGKRYRVEEVSCRATGARCCRHRLSKAEETEQEV